MLGFVFPGQGSQRVGMLADLSAGSPLVRGTFDEANDALGFDLAAVMAAGPEEELKRTSITQPAVLTASVALWRLWCQRSDARPQVVAGHSLGEYTALVAAESLAFDDAVRLVHQRGELMQAAVPEGEGGMAAIIGLDDATIEAICADIDDVAPANYNAPGQVVLAGRAEAIERAIMACKAAGAKRALPVAMSVPSHSALLQPAAQRFGELLDAVEIAPPTMTLYRNVDARISRDVADLRAALKAQLCSPVRWVDCVQAMSAAGADQFVECGPGNVLAGLMRRIDRALTVHRIDSAEALDAAVDALG